MSDDKPVTPDDIQKGIKTRPVEKSIPSVPSDGSDGNKGTTVSVPMEQPSHDKGIIPSTPREKTGEW
jgi:hypothetical protein